MKMVTFFIVETSVEVVGVDSKPFVAKALTIDALLYKDSI